MTSRQNARINMYNAVNAVCNDSPDAVGSNPAFADALTKFRTKLEDLVKPGTESVTKITGTAEQKTVDKEALSQEIVVIASILASYASSINDLPLEKKCEYSVSVLTRMRDTDFNLVTNLIINLANEHLANLTKFKLTQEMIDKAATLRKAYVARYTSPRNAIASKKVQNDVVKATLSEINFVFRKQMNKLVGAIKQDYPQFAADYKVASKVVDTSVRHKKEPKPVVTAASEPVLTVAPDNSGDTLKIA